MSVDLTPKQKRNIGKVLKKFQNKMQKVTDREGGDVVKIRIKTNDNPEVVVAERKDKK